MPAPDPWRLLHELEVHQVELKIQNEELVQSRAHIEVALGRYAALFHGAPVGYAVATRAGIVEEINDFGARLLTRAWPVRAGPAFATAVHEGDRDHFYVLLNEAAMGAVPHGVDVRLATSATSFHHIHITASPLRGIGQGVLLVFVDVTEQREAARRLAISERALREAARHKDDFIAALSHELRNPLAPIRNGLYLLDKAEAGSASAKRALGIIERQVSHLGRLVDELLDITRIARGKVELVKARTELGDLIRHTMDDHRAAFEQSGVRLEGHFEPGLLWVNVDADRIVQALSNVLINADKFTPRGGLVVVALRRDGRDAVIAVKDTGVGIDPAAIAHVFEPFSQAPQSIDRARGGLGMGLAMVKGLVELHGGKATIASPGPNKGTEVFIHLPLEAEAARPAEARREQPQQKRRRVLVVEDNVDAAETLCGVLALMGHDVRSAGSGQDALDISKVFDPEVVLCDLGLPGMDGYEVSRALRACATDGGKPYLVAVSGYAQPDDRARTQAAGFDEHLAKPLHIDELQRLLASLHDDDEDGEPSEDSVAVPGPEFVQ